MHAEPLSSCTFHFLFWRGFIWRQDGFDSVAVTLSYRLSSLPAELRKERKSGTEGGRGAQPVREGVVRSTCIMHGGMPAATAAAAREAVRPHRVMTTTGTKDAICALDPTLTSGCRSRVVASGFLSGSSAVSSELQKSALLFGDRCSRRTTSRLRLATSTAVK